MVAVRHNSLRHALIALIGVLSPFPALAANGPYLVKDINPGQLPSSPRSMTKVGDRLFFNADDGVHGQELWLTDGTEQGTYMVIDLVPGSDGSVPQFSMADLNGTVIFHADNNDDGWDVYRSDGTAQGTTWIGEVNDGDDPIPDGSCTFNFYDFEEAGRIVFFVGENPVNVEALWRTDGTPQGTVKIIDVEIGQIESVGSVLFFAGSGTGLPGSDLWKSDGTVEGTVRLRDLGGLIWLTESSGRVFFRGRDSQTDDELWVSDGTPQGTVRVKDIYPGPNPSTPFELTDVEGTMFFTAFAPVFGREIWKSDGTEAGTEMLIDLVPGAGNSGAYDLTNVDGTLFFARLDALEGWQLWKSDGTEEGTVVVKVIAPTSLPSKYRPDFLTAVNGKLYFSADDGMHGEELWVSNGNDWGTFMIADIDPGIDATHPDNFVGVGPILFFAAGGLGAGHELWAFDTREPVIPALSPMGVVILAAALIGAGCWIKGRVRRPQDQPI